MKEVDSNGDTQILLDGFYQIFRISQTKKWRSVGFDDGYDSDISHVSDEN